MALLELVGIQKSFPGARVLSDVSFDLQPGEVHALVGANGAGKSTLIKILAGAYSRDEGEIRINGEPVRIRNPHEGLECGIGVIYQEFNLVPELTVAENIVIGQEPITRIGGLFPVMSRRAIFETAEKHLRELGFELDSRTAIKDLATGEKQLVEIAKALFRKAKILVLDEPTAALSRRETERLFTIMRSLQQRGIGMIYISHHLEEVFEISDRITVLRDGRNIKTWPCAQLTEAELVEAMVGRSVETGIRPDGRGSTAVLEAEAISGRGFRDVSLQVRGGEILALTGAAGAGQMELLWAFYGALPITSGTLKLKGNTVRWRSLREAIRAGVLLSPGDRKVFGIIPALDVRTNFTFADLKECVKAGILQPGRQRQLAVDRIRRYGVRCSGPEQEIQTLSGGNQQKVVVGRVAERNGVTYLFDEPTRGVDVGAREEIYALIQQLVERGAAVVVSTPDIQEALRLGNRVGVMRQGSLVYLEAADKVTEHAVLAAIVGG